MDPFIAAVLKLASKRLAAWWLEHRPLSKESRAARQDRREERKRLKKAGLSRKEIKMQLDLGTRTSTNTLVGGGIVSSVLVQLIGLLPFPGLVAALTTPEMTVLLASVVAWFVARISKTPDAPKML